MDDTWDWPFLMYVGTVVLLRSERQFWSMTPRKLTALAKVHADVHGGSDEKDKDKKKANVGFIDQVL